MKIFLVPANRNILNISYSIIKRQVVIQVIHIEGSALPDDLKRKVELGLSGFDVKVQEKHITKRHFNENRGE